MRVLVICDDYWHPARTARTGLAPLEGHGFEFDWIENARDWSAETMQSYPVVLLTKSDDVSATDQSPWLTDEVQAAFTAYVQSGNGLLLLHSGTVGVGSDQQSEIRRLTGGTFASHPAQCPVTVEPRADHLLSAGSAAFTQVDEHYMMHFDDAEADVFLTTRSEHASQPGGWTRSEGQGRVCVLTPGHNIPVWLDPNYQVLIANALHWCGKQE